MKYTKGSLSDQYNLSSNDLNSEQLILDDHVPKPLVVMKFQLRETA
jgi:hypothetical protein